MSAARSSSSSAEVLSANRSTKAVPLIGPSRCFERECRYLTGIIDVPNLAADCITDGAHRWACPAFPDGIPDDIAYGDNLHERPDPRQEGALVFEPFEASEASGGA